MKIWRGSRLGKGCGQTDRSAFTEISHSVLQTENSSCYCMWHSWLTKIGVVCLNQLVHFMRFVQQYIFQGLPRVRFLTLGTFPAGFSHHGNSRVFLDGNWPPREPFPRELATTGIHGVFVQQPATTGKLAAGTGHHGKSSRGK